MKLTIIRAIAFMMIAFVVTSCLEGDDMNTPPGASRPFLAMTYVDLDNTGTTLRSGLRYFSDQALVLDPTEDNVTLRFAVSLQGVTSINKNINVTLTKPESALDDYLANDQIEYEMMPSEGFTLPETSGVIHQDTGYVEFEVVIHPSKIDLQQNYMLPISATNDAGLEMSSNYGIVYLHIIGNPLAGVYTQRYIRYNNPEGTGSPVADDIFDTVFAPQNGTTITVGSGIGVTYVLTFNDDNGVLSDFQVDLDDESVEEAGITITSGPVIVEADPANGIFEFNFTYNNSSGAGRNITDIFEKH